MDDFVNVDVEVVLVVMRYVNPFETYAVQDKSVQQSCCPLYNTHIFPTVQYVPLEQHCPFNG